MHELRQFANSVAFGVEAGVAAAMLEVLHYIVFRDVK